MIRTSAQPLAAPPLDLGFGDFQYNEVAENADGSSLYEISDSQPVEPLRSDEDFYANLANEVDENTLSGIASTLLEEISIDLESREQWENTITLVMKYLGWQVSEFRQKPFAFASSAFDSTLSEALLTTYATTVSTIFPAGGPVNSSINGVPTPMSEDEAERTKLYMNYYLTQEDEEYYPDSKQSVLYTLFFGSCFKKVFIDPIKNKPLSRMIKPQDFIVNMDTTSILSSTRITHRTFLTKSAVLKREAMGVYLPETLSNDPSNSDEQSNIDKTIKRIDGIQTSESEKKSLFVYYECHVEWSPKDLEHGIYRTEDDLPRPYIITIAEDSRKIASIRRAWKPESQDFERRHYFVHHQYLPGFGLYGQGIAHLAGSNSVALTAILRQLIDKGTLNNFPGGLRQKGLQVEENDINIGPTDFKEIDTAGRPIQDCVMLMPYTEPSQVLANMIENLAQKTKNHLGIPNTEIPENVANIGTGAALTFMEANNRVQTIVLQSLHSSYSLEFRYLKELFAEVLPDTPYPFSVPGKDMAIMRQDFNDRVNIVPVSDPNVLTSAQKLMNADAQLKTASTNPQIHNMKEIYRRVYAAMNVDDIDKIIPKDPEPQSLDPVSENMLVMSGAPIAVKIGQDHQSHYLEHVTFANELKAIDPGKYASLMMHAQVHRACELVEANQELMQNPQIMQMNPQEFLLHLGIQNMIAQKDAEALFNEQERQRMEAEQNKPVNPTEALMADIEQRREAAHLKDEETKLKAETESYKATLKHEAEIAKIDAQREIAEDKNEVQMFLAKMKNPNQHPEI